ncbi:MAG: aminotransferase class I/II-fold pyridoxal phosphate-dependent enzyme [Fimbriimonadaceae bacterium]|nr:aminotransferase class I/II-fold pyridoxal phosphate-dependent enzyme [Fimbriimonadaceae bacterium]
MRFATKSIRVGQDPALSQNMAVIPPIVQSATFAWPSLDDIPRFDYTRVANPNRAALEEVFASLENGRHAVAYGSGMAAVMAALSLLKSGDHLLLASDIYGGTYRVYENVLPRRGIEGSEFDASRPETIREHARPNTKMVMFETPTNPNLRVMDIAAIAREAKALGLITVIDNTFATPALTNPLDLGIDIVVHSTTKYLSGHSDVIGGALITNDDTTGAWAFEHLKTEGAGPSPFDCWLTLRGVKTLSVRMERHCRNAQAVAEFLMGHHRAGRVHYPGLPSHPDHALAARQMRGFGGMVTFEVAGTEADARKVAESLRVFLLAESLGGVESLVGYPKLMSHGSMTEEQRLAKGIPPTMLRLSVGIEDADDLIEDLDQALRAV